MQTSGAQQSSDKWKIDLDKICRGLERIEATELTICEQIRIIVLPIPAQPLNGNLYRIMINDSSIHLARVAAYDSEESGALWMEVGRICNTIHTEAWTTWWRMPWLPLSHHPSSDQGHLDRTLLTISLKLKEHCLLEANLLFMRQNPNIVASLSVVAIKSSWAGETCHLEFPGEYLLSSMR